MTLMKKIVLTFLSVALTVLTLASCQYKDLEDESPWARRPAVTLGFEWDAVDSIPAGMRVAFYSSGEASQGYVFYDVLNRDTVIRVAAGTYDVTAWNNDCSHVLTSGYSTRGSVNATTLQYSTHGLYVMDEILDSIYNGQRVLDYPDYMVHANVEQFILNSGSETQRLTLHPDSMIFSMDVNVGGIRGLGNVTEARGCINNVPGTRYIAKENVTADSAVVIFDCKVIPEEERVTAHFHLFGLEPTDFPNLEHKIILFFWLQNGRVYIPLDVTNLIRKALSGGYKVKIDIPDLDIDLRDFVTPESGYDVSVEGWDNVVIGVDL